MTLEELAAAESATCRTDVEYAHTVALYEAAWREAKKWAIAPVHQGEFP